jgi:fatty-acyl-CoA synthase
MAKIAPMTTGYIYTNNLCAPFFDYARRNPKSIALVYQGKKYHYADVVAQIDAAIDLFAELGVKRGDRLVFIGNSQPVMIITLFALARMGAVHLAINPRCSAAEVTYILNDAGAAVAVVALEFQNMVEGIRGKLPCKAFIGIESAPAGWSVIRTESITGTRAVSRHLICQTRQEDLAVMLYTSGTTGKPKGVMITHGNVWATMSNVNMLFRLNASTTLLSMAPMFHIGALAYGLAVLAAGGKIVILSAFDADQVYEAMETWQVTMSFGVPTMLAALEHHPRFAGHDFTGLSMTVAGTPVPVTMLETWLSRGAGIIQGWGMTEGGGTILESNKSRQKIGSAGQPLPLTEIEIRDIESGATITESGEKGQIWMRGPTVTKGYWNQPEETAKSFDSEGWFATGDIGCWDEDGFIYIVGRIKEMIITGGMNVYPSELEKVLCDHPRVASAAVVGLPDEKWGERVTALIVPRGEDPVDEKELLAYCREMMSNYKVPRQFEFLDSFPVGPTGKILKMELQARYSK